MNGSQDLREIFTAAVEIEDDAARRAFLAQACGDNADLRARVETLLLADRRTDSFLAAPVPSLSAAAPGLPPLKPGDDVGPYQLAERLGEGGMGTVFLATQQQPVRRKVAVKAIKLGLDSAQVIARFNAERQALARMNHPGIAQVYDAGTTPDERLYFAMELVDGPPITSYCAARELPPHECVALFISVCQAVHHAHQRGILHRDIKPSNVLVSTIDGKPCPKVIDFGLAKALSRTLTEHTMLTEFGQIMGTPAYMSPEQTAFHAVDIDTRSDVYSLGILLYELVTGHPPLHGEELQGSGVERLLRLIREHEPRRPSSQLRVDRLRAGAVSDVATRSRRWLRGDMDTIIMKAISKERDLRYDSAAAMADDLQRFLDHEPIEARPPTFAYRARKFTRRHWVTSAVAVLFTILLAGGTAWSTRAAIRATRSEQQAIANMRLTNGVNDFINHDLLAGGSAERTPGEPLLLRTVLDRAARRVDARFEDQPDSEARIRGQLGWTLYALGEYGSARPQLEQALALNRKVYGDTHEETITSMNNLAMLLHAIGEYGESEALLQQCLEFERQARPADHPEVLRASHNLASHLFGIGKLDEAEPLLAETLAKRRRVLGDHHNETVATMNNLALLYLQSKDFERATPLFEEAYQACLAVHGEDHPNSMSTLHNLARLHDARGERQKAESLFLQALEASRRVLGGEHPDTLLSEIHFASLLGRTGRHREATELLWHVYETRLESLGSTHQDTSNAAVMVAMSQFEGNRFDDAAELMAERLAAERETLGETHPNTLRAKTILARAYRMRGDLEPSRKLLVEVVAANRELFGATHARTRGAVGSLAGVYADQGDLPRAASLYTELLEAERERVPPNRSRLVTTLGMLGMLHIRSGNLAPGVDLLEELATLDRELRTTDPRRSIKTVAGEIVQLAAALVELGRFERGEQVAAESLPLLIAANAGSRHRIGCRLALARSLVGQKRWEQAESAYLDLWDDCGPQESGESDPRWEETVEQTLNGLIQVSRELKRPDAVARWTRIQQERRANEGP